MLLLQAGQRMMRGVRPGIAKPPPAEIVEFVHAGRIAGEAFGRCHLFEIELFPQSVFVAERAEPALGRKPGAGQDDDAAESHLAFAGLAAMAEVMVGQHDGDHRLADRHRADADARIMAAFGRDLGVVALCVDRLRAASGSMRWA